MTKAKDEIKGLSLGSDEYMTKPFYPKELVLRVKKILQKKQGSKQSKSEKKHH